ncbi:SDR family NAD(P)-dependent oxidoreductase [Microbulbifer agarilyticus]|uniref:SDR family NAD(P)-dependent oxidoreductase n=1 Tax=Microbulbifer agarilyticus TaxID=260552 RepID=UPI001CD293C1|nr:SDR family oxidoreductase [Microbulbifer agarilyticus]MCA0900530.1 SDR family oxidoreductase [Microbulbifer agarilyticus]
MTNTALNFDVLDISTLHSLEGKTALVTGASSGLGAYFAWVLAQAGAEVIVAARRMEKLEQQVARIREFGGSAHAVAMDVSRAESVATTFEQLDKDNINLDIVLNNAGVSNPPARFVDQGEQDWERLLDTNLNGAWRVAQQAAKRMKAAGKGCIVNTGSIYSLATGLMKTDYNVSKAAIVQLTKNMALELGRYGVRVNALCPGYFASAINQDEFATERGQAYISRLVPQRLGDYPELAGPLLLLVSDAGSFVSGVALPVDGGSLLAPI